MILDIPGAVKEYLQEQAREPRKRRLGEYYPSEVSDCLRAWFLAFHSNKEYNEEKQGYFEAGIIIEDWIGKVLKWAIEEHQVEFIIPQRHITCVVGDPSERIVLNGKADFLLMLRNKVNLETQLIEVKSASSIYHIKDVKRDHLVQIMPYIWALNPTYAQVVYVDKKNLSHIKAFDITYNPILMEWIIARVRAQHKRIKTMELPMAEALYCKNCMKAKLVIDHKSRPKMASCPNCNWKAPVGETDLWRLSYCPFRGSGKCCADEAEGAKLVVPEEELAKETGDGPE